MTGPRTGDRPKKPTRASQPDVALLDIEMPGGSGLDAAQALQRALPTCRSVILTTFGRSGYLRRAMESGAVGFLLKDAPASVGRARQKCAVVQKDELHTFAFFCGTSQPIFSVDSS